MKFEIIYFDNNRRLNVLALQASLLKKMRLLLPSLKNEKLSAFSKEILDKIFVFRPRTSEEFLLNLKGLKYFLHMNNKIRMMIIDPINILDLFSVSHKGMNYNQKKFRRDSNSVNEKKSLPAKIQSHILEMVEVYSSQFQLALFMTKIQIYKLNQVIQGVDQNLVENNRIYEIFKDLSIGELVYRTTQTLILSEQMFRKSA